jgi:RNA polymerase sigma factor for flagellar operon FliA
VRTLQAQAVGVYGQQNRSQAQAQEQRILQYLPLVKHVVQKVAAQVSQGADYEDLISAGTVGLVKAAQAFDPSRDTEFKTYAYIRIRGAVIDELRTRLPATPKVLKQIRQLRKYYMLLTNRLNRPPGDEELAAEAGITQEQLYRTLAEARRQQFLSIQGMGGEQPLLGGLTPLDREPGPEQQLERKELKQLLAKAIMELPTRDRQVLILYYKEDLTMKEIAEVLKLTEARVSQLHSAALFKLSVKLKPADETAEPQE